MHLIRTFLWLILIGAIKIASCNATITTPPKTQIHSTNSLSTDSIIPRLIDQKQVATPLLKKLLSLYGIQAETFDEIVEETQKQWIAVRQGTGGIERRDLIDTAEQTALREETLKIIKELGLLEEKLPTLNHYTYGVCLGAFLEGARNRLALLIESWKKGIQFDWLIFLGSDRQLRSGIGENEEWKIVSDQNHAPYLFHQDWDADPLNFKYETESDMLKLIWNQADVPVDMKEHLEGHIVFVEAKGKDGKRASTLDTFQTWLIQHEPLPGSVIAASSPHISNYQHLVGIRILGPDFPLDTISSKGRLQDIKISVVLDTIAKCLYEYKLILAGIRA